MVGTGTTSWITRATFSSLRWGIEICSLAKAPVEVLDYHATHGQGMSTTYAVPQRSNFTLAPRGHGVGTFRTFEVTLTQAFSSYQDASACCRKLTAGTLLFGYLQALHLNTVPIVIWSYNWILPYTDLLNWNEIAIVMHVDEASEQCSYIVMCHMKLVAAVHVHLLHNVKVAVVGSQALGVKFAVQPQISMHYTERLWLPAHMQIDTLLDRIHSFDLERAQRLLPKIRFMWEYDYVNEYIVRRLQTEALAPVPIAAWSDLPGCGGCTGR